MKQIRIVLQPNNVYYLVQKIDTEDIYERAKWITEFLEKETIKLEFVINSEIKTLLRQKGIKLLSNTESAYKSALDTLKTDFNKVIDIEDMFIDRDYENCEFIGVSNNGMTVILEHDKNCSYLECGMKIVEREIV